MILVTGGTGLVGSHLLLDLVKSGESVRAIYRSTKSLAGVKKVFSYYLSEEESQIHFDAIEWLEADITEIPDLEKAFSGIEKVYHCAAVISFDPSRDSQLRQTNIEGTANVVNFCIRNHVKKLCFVSSIATLDKKPTEAEINEESNWNKDKDHDMYAITKYGAEMEVWRASQEGVPVVIINPGIIIGPGFWNSGSGKIFKKVHNGLKYYVPKITGFVGVRDVVKIMRQLMDSEISNEQFIVVSENIPFKQVQEQIAEVLQKEPPHKKITPVMAYMGWLFEKIAGLGGRERLLNKQSLKSLFQDHFYRNEKVKQQLNYEFEPVEKVVHETAAIYKKEVTERYHPGKQEQGV